MRIGITGSSGLIGAALIGAARRRGDEIVRFVRPETRASDASSIRWDPARGVLDEDDVRRIGSLDAVVNLSGAGIADRRWSDERKTEILESRTRSTSLLVDAVAALPGGCPVMASGSAIGYYGSRGDELLDEHSSPGDDFLADVCQRWEHAATPLSAKGTKVSYLRTGIVMSSQGGALKKQLPLFRLGLGGRLASGNQWISPISLADEVRAILWVIDHQLEGPINLTSPEPLTNRSFTAELAGEVHRPAFFAVPTPALKLVLGGELVDHAILASQRVLPRRLSESGFEFLHADCRAALHWSISQEVSA